MAHQERSPNVKSLSDPPYPFPTFCKGRTGGRSELIRNSFWITHCTWGPRPPSSHADDDGSVPGLRARYRWIHPSPRISSRLYLGANNGTDKPRGALKAPRIPVARQVIYARPPSRLLAGHILRIGGECGHINF